MRKRPRTTIGLLVSIALLLCLLPLGEVSAQAQTKAKPEGTFIFGADSVGLENFLLDIYTDGQNKLFEAVYDQLIYQHIKTDELIPGLAERWEIEKDARKLTLWLRKGVPFHEGWGEVGAEDVKFTIEKCTREGSTYSRAQDWKKAIDRMEVVDAHTLVIYFKGQDAVMFFSSLVNVTSPYFGILCKKYVEKVGDDEAKKHPIGSGPYRLVEHKMGDSLKFEAFDEHWRVVPEFKYLIYRVVPEESTRVAMLKTGEIDATMITPDKIKDVEKAGFGVSIWPPSITMNLLWGGLIIPEDKRYVEGYHQKDPWKDVRVREAMNLAIDRDAICKAIYSGAAMPISIEMMIPGWKELKPISYDPERAKRLLAEAGYPNGFTLTIRAYTQGGSPEQPKLCETVAAYWEKIGINSKIIQTDYASSRPLQIKGNWAGELLPMAASWLGDYTLRLVSYHVPNQARTLFQSPELTALFRKLVPEIDPKKRVDIWKEIAKYMRDNYTSVGIVVASQIYAYNKMKVGKWPQAPSELMNPAYIRHSKPLNTWRLFEID